MEKNFYIITNLSTGIVRVINGSQLINLIADYKSQGKDVTMIDNDYKIIDLEDTLI